MLGYFAYGINARQEINQIKTGANVSELEATSPLDPSEFIGTFLDSVNTIGNKIANSDRFDRTDIYDPLKFLEYKRAKIDKDYETWQEDAVNSLYSNAGLEDSYQQKMDRLSDAEHYYATGDAKSSADAASQEGSARLQQLRGQFDSAVASETKSDFEKQSESINQNYLEQLQAADHVVNDRTFQSQGFKNQADANAYAQHLRDDAHSIHDSEQNKLWYAREGQVEVGQGRLNVLKQTAAGDQIGAGRNALENELDSESLAIDRNDKERVQQFEKIRAQSLANYDAEASRESQLQAAQSNDRILALGAEAKDAKLRAEGKSDEAKVSALNFETDQRVRSLQEQADAEGDSTKKAQLQREAAAAADAGKIERDALQKELQRQNTQTPALAGASQQSRGNHDVAEFRGSDEKNLAEVARKLDETAGKIDKALSNLKTIVIIKN